MDLLGPLVPLAILVGIVVAIVSILRRRDRTPDLGIGTTRRIFLYGLSFVSLMLAATGVTLLTARLLGALFAGDVIRGSSAMVAFGLASVTIAFPTWALLWRAAQRTTRTHPVETGAFGRKLYVYAILAIAGSVVAITAMSLLSALLESDLEADAFAPLVIWAGIWLLHWRIETAEGQQTDTAATVRRLYTYGMSVFGLVLLASGVISALSWFLGYAYEAAFGGTLAANPDGGGSSGWNMMAVGAALWWYHWHRIASDDAGSSLRQAVTYVVGIFGGTVISIGASTVILVTGLRWILDPTTDRTAAAHFDVIPLNLSILISGLGIAAYHTAVALAEASRSNTSKIPAERAYRYLSASVGLGTVWVGLGLLVTVALGLLVPTVPGIEWGRESLIDQRWWGTPLSISLALLTIGGGLWWKHWPSRLRASRVSDDERKSLSRRAYLSAWFGIAVLSTLGSASAVLFNVFRELLDGTLSVEVLGAIDVPLGVLITAAVVSAYHWLLIREDREDRGAAPTVREVRPRKRITAISTVDATDSLNELERLLGVSIARRFRMDDVGAPDLTPEQLTELTLRVHTTPGDEVLLIVDRDGIQLIAL